MEEREEEREESGEAKLKEGRRGMKRTREGDPVIPRHAQLSSNASDMGGLHPINEVSEYMVTSRYPQRS